MRDPSPQASPTITALLADVDGTLVTKAKVVTQRARQAVKQMRERGLVFTITSGRPPRGLRMLVEPLDLTMPIGAFNGAAIVLPDLSVLDERPLPDYLLRPLVETISDLGLDVWLYTATDWYVRNGEAPRVDRERSTVQFEPTVVSSFDSVLTGVVKVVAVSLDESRVAACEVTLQREFGALLTAARSNPYYVDVTHPTANKGTMIERLARYMKIPAAQIATIGDQANDVLMFRRSGLSIAMGNASPEVQREAMCVTTSHEDEGFAEAVERFILPRAVAAPRTATRTTAQLHRLGQSLWLAVATSELLTPEALERCMTELSVSGLTSGRTLVERLVALSSLDAKITELLAEGRAPGDVFFEIMVEHLRRAADLFRPIYDQTAGVDGWVSLEAPHAGYRDPTPTLAAARQRYTRIGRPNLMVEIPGTREELSAIEEAVVAGIPVNVTQLFSREQYFAAAEAYLRGLERRVEQGLKPDVGSVASVSVSSWDAAVRDKVPGLRGRLGVAMAKRIYQAYRSVLASPRWQRIYNVGGRTQRLLWANTTTGDSASDVSLTRALSATFTVNAMPEATLKALADSGSVPAAMAADGGDSDEILATIAGAGIDLHALAARLQEEAVTSSAQAWSDLAEAITLKAAALSRHT
jgi:transaldolase